MEKYSLAALLLSVAMILPCYALADNNGKYLDVCDKAISARQAVPSLYKRTDAHVSSHPLSRDEIKAVLQNIGLKDQFLKKRLDDYDAGSFTPVDITVIVEYEATNKQSEIVKKRSECQIRENSKSEELSPDLAKVDGQMKMLWEQQN